MKLSPLMAHITHSFLTTSIFVNVDSKEQYVGPGALQQQDCRETRATAQTTRTQRQSPQKRFADLQDSRPGQTPCLRHRV